MRIRRSSLSIAVAAGAAALLLTALSPSSAAAPGHGKGAENLGDPDYGVCRGTDSRCYHDWGNFDPAEGYRLLVYSRTAGPRHAHLGTPLGSGMNPPLNDDNVAVKAMLELGRENGFAVDYTEDVTQLSSAGRLLPYNAVMFLSTTRDTLDDAAQTALRQYIRAGGGFVGVHNAFGTEYNWPWYEGLLGNANFYDHSANQPGVVETVGRRDASTQGLPQRWAFSDEWYNLVPFPTRVRVLAEVDESTLARGVRGNLGHPGHGDDHPVSWCQYYDGGKAWLTTLGHDVKAWTDEPMDGDRYFVQHLLGGVKSVLGMAPFCR
ncbi:ThuA domain-containing protein [Streptosporangium sp. NBC_01756]|uniref:ThuA domain-containing protein n=1 Tax=Streptosporangium sp. NBC_01756 TaxID=2975950 RepID=UPI002DD840A6|nr:ThuA domain-containing protein [Streptosporangium sp. NBC_01756]WSC86241.1 ThuA domain-containing protein [Streptosporangium sp. NBC_01756]